MKKITLNTAKTRISDIKNLTDSHAKSELGSAVCLSWHDIDRGVDSPSDARMCRSGRDVAQYARNLGGELEIEVNKGKYRFFYRNDRGYDAITAKSPRLKVEDVDGYFM